ncbi:MAG TPA: NAD(P)H-dependent oxidoreductase [Clostridia bacterium]|nr:NAD(P)H-dependent oxidoreductase [Clostridia bacterium]
MLMVVTIGSSVRLDNVLDTALKGAVHSMLSPREAMGADLKDRRVLFALSVDAHGIDATLTEFLRYLNKNERSLEGSVGALITDGQSDLYTKELSRVLIFSANRAGCTFLGKALTEATGSLQNFETLAKRAKTDVMTAYKNAARELVLRLKDFWPPKKERPRILTLHSSLRETSNTLALGHALEERLAAFCDIDEISLGEGRIRDCRGCSYTMCAHFAQADSCFYGATIFEDIFPAVLACDALLLLCPNYNDALGANITAFINRLTALLTKNTLYDKAVYAAVVSGYSGGDIVARQVLGSFCLNKTFYLPPRFALLETANDPGTAMRRDGIERTLDNFANGMLMQLKKE